MLDFPKSNRIEFENKKKVERHKLVLPLPKMIFEESSKRFDNKQIEYKEKINSLNFFCFDFIVKLVFNISIH